MSKNNIATTIRLSGIFFTVFAYLGYQSVLNVARGEVDGGATEILAVDDRISRGAILRQTNVARGEGASSLTMNVSLQKAAQKKAEDMAGRGYFAHDTPEGKAPWLWIQEEGYVYESAGENLAVNFDTGQDVIDEWIASPSHRHVLLGEQYKEVGIGIAFGKYGGVERATYVVEFFAQPKRLSR